MFESFIAWLVVTFLLNPFGADLQSRMAAAQAPAAVVQGVTQCAAAAGPALIDRASGDPLWAISTVVGTWIGTTSPEAVLRDAAPGCGPAMAAARPFLG